jgi:hypothetical protein
LSCLETGTVAGNAASSPKAHRGWNVYDRKEPNL